MIDTIYYWAYWVSQDPATGKIIKGVKGYELTESALISKMAELGKSRNDYEILPTKYYGEAQVKHIINDLIAHKVRNIDKAIIARYKTPQRIEGR